MHEQVVQMQDLSRKLFIAAARGFKVVFIVSTKQIKEAKRYDLINATPHLESNLTYQ